MNDSIGERLGVMGVEEIKAHPFFAGINWKTIRNKASPNIPKIANEEDTKYFEEFPEESPWVTHNGAR